MTITLLLLSAGLATDAFAVSVGYGISLIRPNLRTALAIALTFALFQALMPVLGWSLGWALSGFIMRFHRWIAFLLLAWVGGKMVLDGLRANKTQSSSQLSTKWQQLLALALATSIDAFAVGITLALTQADIVVSALTIGAVTFLLCAIGFQLGRLASHLSGQFLKDKATIIGGFVLIGLGVKILLVN
ncbi:MAG: manganese efflux pump MntP family protein [Peptococcaceae bacterium]|nr:manganese efflux pump MntP family protein [Peptococcaceae bacterium]